MTPIAFCLSRIVPTTQPSLTEALYADFYPSIHERKLNPTAALAFYLATYVEKDLRALAAIKDLLIFAHF